MQSIASIIIIRAKTTQCYLSRLVLEVSITKQTARQLVNSSTYCQLIDSNAIRSASAIISSRDLSR